ncbi:MAG: hypothetical protein ACM3IJ_04330 [Candidatus Levyibacteriota bacterium]
MKILKEVYGQAPYSLDRQEMAVHEEQQAGHLFSIPHLVAEKPFVVSQQMHEWVKFDGGIYLRKHCDPGILELEPGNLIMVVAGMKSAGKFKFRGDYLPSAQPVAALFSGEDILYKSPAFDLDKFLRQKAS